MIDTVTQPPLVSRGATVTTPAFWDGFTGFSEGAQLEEMPTGEHAQGWFYASRCEGDTNDYADSIVEREFVRFGGN